LIHERSPVVWRGLQLLRQVGRDASAPTAIAPQVEIAAGVGGGGELVVVYEIFGKRHRRIYRMAAHELSWDDEALPVVAIVAVTQSCSKFCTRTDC
jgi:hypothetical protein